MTTITRWRKCKFIFQTCNRTTKTRNKTHTNYTISQSIPSSANHG